MMERLAAANGPTKGEIVRPSDGKKVNNLAFVQCAGSRDTNHLPYCSSICCLASLKQATYLRDYNPDAQAHIFYIDLRAYGRFEFFYDRVRQDDKILLTKGKIVNIRKIRSRKTDSRGRRHTLRQEDSPYLRYGCPRHRYAAQHQLGKGSCPERAIR